MVVILMILFLVFCGCIVVVMWSLIIDHFSWSQFVVSNLLFFCSGYFKEVINIKFIILYKTIVLYDIYLKLIYISILLDL